MTATIDVVIPVLNGWEMTERTLEHLGHQTLAHTTVLVDNGSTDGTPDRVRERFPEVTVVEQGSNDGFGLAGNKGASLGTGEILLFLSNDCFLGEGFLDGLARAFEDPRVGSATPLVLCTD